MRKGYFHGYHEHHMPRRVLERREASSSPFQWACVQTRCGFRFGVQMNAKDPPGYLTRCYRLPEGMVRDLERAAHQHYLGREALVQRALREWLAANLKEEPI